MAEAVPASTAATPDGLEWVLLTFRKELLERWTRRVLEDPAVPDANRLPKPALEDHVPQLIDRLLRRLANRPSEPWGERAGREVGASGVGVAHARQRIAQRYTLPEALRELSLFRLAVLGLCEERRVSLSRDEAELFHATIDEVMTTSACELERISRGMYEQLMAVVAHDLRNPLGTIQFQATRLKRGTLDAVTAEKAGDALTRNAQMMNRLIGDLLTFSSLQAGHLPIEAAELGASDIVREVCEQVRPLAERRGIEIVTALPDREIVLRADRDRLVQALGNVAGNAVKFSPDNGIVFIELEAGSRACVFRVRDTGPGVAPEHVEDVFRPFWQAHANKHGMGLGLAIARGIVEAHGGEIAIEQGGPGATFAFSVPYDGIPSATASLPSHWAR